MSYGDVTVTGTVAKPRTQLKRRLRRVGLTQDVIAAEVVRRQVRPVCTRTYVNHFLNGRRDPVWLRMFIDALLVERETRAS